MLEELGDLRTLAGACLADNNENRACLDQIQQSLSVFGNGQEGCRFVESRDKGGTEIKFGHAEWPNHCLTGVESESETEARE
jgi:hypothetical protein